MLSLEKRNLLVEDLKVCLGNYVLGSINDEYENSKDCLIVLMLILDYKFLSDNKVDELCINDEVNVVKNYFIELGFNDEELNKIVEILY